jgi:hypothetical protein
MTMLRPACTLLLLCLTTLSVFAQTLTPDSLLPQNNGRPQFESTELRITGCVHNQTGIALESARVEAHDLQSGTLLASAYTNANGVFELTGLRQGIYEIVTLAGVNQARQQVKLQTQETIVYVRVAIDGADEDSI